MNIQPTNQQPISDDQELAKVLAGINQQANEPSAMPIIDQIPTQDSTNTEPVAMSAPESTFTPAPIASPSGANDLESIKKDALSELRPLVDKLNVSPEEKFDTYLLLLRSTDDQALIAPAHEAARGITDEARRAQALLDIIKEIDYLAGPQQQA